MTPVIITVIVLILAAGLLALRVPILVALGLPSTLTLLFTQTPQMLQTSGLSLISVFNTYSFMGFVLWAGIAGILVKSGLMEQYFTALHIVFGRQVTLQRRKAWQKSFHGLPMTTVTLLLLAGSWVLPDNHFLLLQMLIVLVLTAVLVGAWMIFSAPPVSHLTLKRMQSTSANSWKKTGEATAEVSSDGSTRRINSKKQAALVLMLPALVFLLCLILVLISPVGLADLAALVWPVFLVTALITRGVSWLGAAGWYTVLTVGTVGANVSGAWLLANTLTTLEVVPKLPVDQGFAMFTLLFTAVIGSAVLGKILGSEAAALLTVAVLSPSLTVEIDAAVSSHTASAILTSLLVGAAILGGIFARLLPPRTWPWPQTPSPVI